MLKLKTSLILKAKKSGDQGNQIAPYRDRKTNSPQNDYYWQMDQRTYNIMRQCPHRVHKIILEYKRRMKKRDKYIKTKEYLVVAEERTIPISICLDLFCCCKPRK